LKKRYASAGTILKAGISLVLLAIILLKLDWSKAAALICNSDPIWWFVALLITLGAVVISAYKWQLILESQRVKIAIPKLVSSYFIGLFLNNFLPTSMGGDVFRAYDVARISGETPKAVASVITERVLAMATLAVSAVAGLLFDFTMTGRFTWMVVLFCLACGVLLWASLDIRWIGHLTRLLSFINTDSIRLKVEEAKWALQRPIRDRQTLFSVLLLSLVFQAAVIAVHLAVFKALRIDADLIFLMIFVPLVSAVSMLPVSINGIGVHQGTSIVLYGAVGISATQATAQSLGFMLVVTLSSLPGSLLLILRKSEKEESIS
jgi:glycosyltransferase 2 family protein